MAQHKIYTKGKSWKTTVVKRALCTLTRQVLQAGAVCLLLFIHIHAFVLCVCRTEWEGIMCTHRSQRAPSGAHVRAHEAEMDTAVFDSPYHILFWDSFLIETGASNSARLARQQVPVCLAPIPRHWWYSLHTVSLFLCVLGIWTQVLTCVQ